MKWFRLYTSILHDPKVQRLPAGAFKLWINLLAIACDQDADGRLPEIHELSLFTRLRPSRVQAGIDLFTECGLIDAKSGRLFIHNWGGRQYVSDDVSARVKRSRERYRNVTVTPPEERRREEKRLDIPVGAQAPFRAAAKSFVAAPKNERVAKLIDLAKSLGMPRSGLAAAIVRDHGHGQGVVDAVLQAAQYADGDPWEYMEGVLQNEKSRRAGKAGSNAAGSSQRVGTAADWERAREYARGDTDQP